jgi:hypothetical protein
MVGSSRRSSSSSTPHAAAQPDGERNFSRIWGLRGLRQRAGSSSPRTAELPAAVLGPRTAAAACDCGCGPGALDHRGDRTLAETSHAPQSSPMCGARTACCTLAQTRPPHRLVEAPLGLEAELLGEGVGVRCRPRPRVARGLGDRGQPRLLLRRVAHPKQETAPPRRPRPRTCRPTRAAAFAGPRGRSSRCSG